MWAWIVWFGVRTGRRIAIWIVGRIRVRGGLVIRAGALDVDWAVYIDRTVDIHRTFHHDSALHVDRTFDRDLTCGVSVLAHAGLRSVVSSIVPALARQSRQ
jgi:hypothetical protein